MVKINLLRERSAEPTPQMVVKAPVDQKPILIVVIGVIIVICALLGLGFFAYAKYQKMGKLSDDVKQKEIRVKALEETKKKIAELEKTIETLQNRTKVIEQLKENQTGPVEMMNSLILSLPEKDSKVWIEDIKQTSKADSDVLHIKGYGYDVDSILRFYVNLQGSKSFDDISFLYYDTTKSPVVYEFDCIKNKKKTTEKEAKNG